MQGDGAKSGGSGDRGFAGVTPLQGLVIGRTSTERFVIGNPAILYTQSWLWFCVSGCKEPWNCPRDGSIPDSCSQPAALPSTTLASRFQRLTAVLTKILRPDILSVLFLTFKTQMMCPVNHNRLPQFPQFSSTPWHSEIHSNSYAT